MRFVPVKSAEAQAQAMALTVRELLVKQRTQLVNALRGHAAEFGIVAARGLANATALLTRIAEDPAMPEAAKNALADLGRQIAGVDAELAALDRKLADMHKANPVSQLLDEVPGIGTIGALSLALTIDPAAFKSGRHFAAWLGLTPKERSTGGKQRMGGISREGKRTPAPGAGARRDLGHPSRRQARQQAGHRMAHGIAGTQAAAWSPPSPWPTRWPASCGP